MKSEFFNYLILLVFLAFSHACFANQCFSDPKVAYTHLLAQEKAAKNPIININTATAAEFLTLKGVGVKTAEAIIDYRQAMGRFRTVDDLTHVKGIGQKTVDNNRHRLRAD